MKEVTYKGQKCLIVYFIPQINRKGIKQGSEDRVYLSYPFNYTVSISEIKNL